MTADTARRRGADGPAGGEPDPREALRALEEVEEELEGIERALDARADGGGEASDGGRGARSRAPARRRDPGELSLRNVRALLLGIPSFTKLLWRLVRDPRVSKVDRALFAGALAYALAPVDLIPDWLAVLGQMDDLVVVALVLSRLLYRVDEEVLLEHWEGAVESLEVMEALLQRLVDALPWWARRLV